MLSPHETAAIECDGLTKRYSGGLVAPRDLSLRIPRDAAFGLLGENDAVKSTLVRLAMGFIFPTSGTVRVLGERDPAQAHPHVGYVHERPIFEPRFTGHAHLTHLAALAGLFPASRLRRVEQLLHLVRLSPSAHCRCGTYFKGMHQRLAIAQALLDDPELLVLDEPTSGLDPLAQYEIGRLIVTLRAQGKTILLCSHYLAEVEAICAVVGILRCGRLIQHGAVADVLRPRGSVEIELGGGRAAAEVVARLGHATLRPMTDDEFAALKAALYATYLEERARAVGGGTVVTQEEIKAGKRQVDERMSAGIPSKSHHNWKIVAPQAGPVSDLWVMVDDARHRAFIYFIDTDTAYRGHHYGQQALEVAVRPLGVMQIALNVKMLDSIWTIACVKRHGATPSIGRTRLFSGSFHPTRT